MAALLLVDFADELFTFLPAGSIEQIRTDVGLSYAQAGAVLALLPAGGLVGTACTVAADFVSRRRLASAGAFAYGACLLVFAGSTSFVALAVAAFAWGAASDAFVHGSSLALADLAGDDLEPMLARRNLLGSIGDLLGPVAVAVPAIAGVGWRPAFALGGLLMVAYGVWLASLPLPAPRPDGARPWATIHAVVRDRRVWWLAAFLAVSATLDEPFLGFLVAFLDETRGLGGGLAPLLVGAMLVGALGGYTVLAARPVSWSAPVSFVFASAVELVTVAMMLLVPAAPVIAVAAAAFGAVQALHWVTLESMVLRLRPNQRGTTWAVIALLSLPGIGFAPFVGVAADRFGLGTGVLLYLAVPPAILALVAIHPDQPLRSLWPWRRSVRSS